MTWVKPTNPGLLELADTSPAEWWLIYSKFHNPNWFARLFGRLLKPGFQHVCAMKRDGRVWLLLNMNTAYVDIEIMRTDAHPQELFPHSIVQRVVSYRRMDRYRHPWIAGPITCVELVKAVLGIPNFFLWTPHQLHVYCSKGILRWDRHRKRQSPPPRKNSPNVVRLKN